MLLRKVHLWNFLIKVAIGTIWKIEKIQMRYLARRIIAPQLSCRYHKIQRNFYTTCVNSLWIKEYCRKKIPSFWKENPRTYFADKTPFKKWWLEAIRKKRCTSCKRCIWGTGATTRPENGNQNSGCEIMGGEYVLTDLSQMRKWRKCGWNHWKRVYHANHAWSQSYR